ncbi:MAG: hypothetical protein BWY19_00070 [bacterium ADurb.Bin212]|nr:MAG: hypothetical protein BWY19_00070 [bacterium ADurb.Bin212]
MTQPASALGRYSAAIQAVDELGALGIVVEIREATNDDVAEGASYSLEAIRTAIEEAEPKPKTWEEVLAFVGRLEATSPASVTITSQSK